MASATNPPLSEEAKLYSWRLEELERLGYSTSDAADLAVSRVDLHELAALVRAGCDRDLARAILT